MSTPTHLTKKRCTDPECCTFDIPVHTDFTRCVACGGDPLDDISPLMDAFFGFGAENPWKGIR